MSSKTSSAIALYYSSSKENLGDAVNPVLIGHLSNRFVKHSAAPQAEIFCIGSILDKLLLPFWDLPGRIIAGCKKPLYIWSSGFIAEPSKNMVLARKVNVAALRGRFSQKIMERLTGQKLSIPLGDGGLLMSELLDSMPEKKYSVGIIPHYKELESEKITQLLQKVPEAVLISPLGDPVETVRKIAACKTIISSSLHGLIVADSLHIPNLPMVASSQVRGGSFKYQDYYSSYSLEYEPIAIDDMLNDPPDAEYICRKYRISSELVEACKGELKACFPVL